jgi:putative spermidine/putrescine transport system ATP-binding protein
MNAGRLEQVGTPAEIYERPASAFVATFIGRMNRLAARAMGPARLSVDGGEIRATHGVSTGDAATIMVRPHRIRLAQVGRAPANPGNRLFAVVRKLVFAGDTLQYELAVGGSRLVVEQPTLSAGVAPFAPGDAVVASWDVADTLVFPETAVPGAGGS